MSCSLIAAMSENRVIGKDNALPWHLSEDLQRFKKLTMGHPLVMGRKTYESIGKPLPGRENIVLTQDHGFKATGARVVFSLSPLIEEIKNSDQEYFVIGGEAIYKQFFPHSDKIYLTLIHKAFEGDAYFPELHWRADFEILESISGESQQPPHLPYTFITAKRC